MVLGYCFVGDFKKKKKNSQLSLLEKKHLYWVQINYKATSEF